MKASDIIKEMRNYRGVSAGELAGLIGVSKQRMSAIERADDLSFSTIQRICAALNFEVFAFPKEQATKEKAPD